MHILLVEDDAAITAGLQYSLSREGYQVTAADCVQAALEQLQHDTAFQLAVIDLRLPDGDGFTVCEKQNKRISLSYF